MNLYSLSPGRTLCGAGLAILLAGLAQADASSGVEEILRAQGFYEAPVIREPHKNKDLVEVEINGHRFKLLIDTGAQTTILRRSAAERAGVPEGADAGIFGGVNGASTEHANVAQISSFTINGVPITPGPVHIADMADYRFGHEQHDGLLGLPTLRLNHVVFGYVPGAFFFNPEGSGTGKLDSYLLTHGYARVRLALERGHYFLPMSFDDIPARMVLDSGAAVTEITRSFGVAARLPAVRAFGKISGVEGRSDLSVTVVPDRIAIGPLALPTIKVMVQTSLPTPGMLNFGDGLAGFDLIGLLSPFVDTGHDWLYIAGKLPQGFEP